MPAFEDIIAALKGGQAQPDAMPFGVGGPAEPVHEPTNIINPLVGTLAQKTMDVPKHLIDAAAQFDPNDIHESTARVVPAATEAAMALMGRGVAAPTAGLGIFGGKLAKTADLDKLIFANKMNEAGHSPTQIWNETGWFKNPADQKWRFEIPDNNARMMGHGLDYGKEASSRTGPANLMLQHPDLYKAYPQLAENKLTNTVYQNPTNKVGTGAFDSERGTLAVNTPNLINARSIGLHESQHGVQELEHFAPGGSPQFMEYLQRHKPSKVPMFEHQAEPFDMYHRLAGEVEARNIQKRMDMPLEARQAQPPWQTQDVPSREQLVLDNNSDMIKALRHLK